MVHAPKDSVSTIPTHARGMVSTVTYHLREIYFNQVSHIFLPKKHERINVEVFCRCMAFAASRVVYRRFGNSDVFADDLMISLRTQCPRLRPPFNSTHRLSRNLQLNSSGEFKILPVYVRRNFLPVVILYSRHIWMAICAAPY